ncbi:MAG: helix-turn-helix transcriptional regulator [Inquilinus sp.]|nr:helix-turn-helix transcriptional regulator [Inquilinus sp.]
MANFSERRIRWILGAVGFGSFALLLSLEILPDIGNLTIFDIASDALALSLTISAAVGVALLAQRMQLQHEEKLELIRSLEVARSEGEGWRKKVQSHLNGLRLEISRQFQEWGMTEAEHEIGLLILKGLSHKEIASLRNTTEATVRQQAQSIYARSRLPGKSAFSAYFLEDLITPDVTTG